MPKHLADRGARGVEGIEFAYDCLSVHAAASVEPSLFNDAVAEARV